jgi:hypothetical protein
MELFRDDQYLEIRNITERDSGIYTCLAENLAGKAKQNLELQVLGEYLFELIRQIVRCSFS